ncbi:alpha/beta hydrolase [Segetibacter sp. 3557_3]|uniref:alpha/beta hydrolase n=1 Tax=Segetibacter sp. 3557_3 TaxID=2547429 RepID=UPI001058A745|nr:alpha/beta hydrolase [Segetibacter sp. 3557_3]TDH21327.1 alpha/beta hydrolase [Segetibacter sp. 3557_3]
MKYLLSLLTLIALQQLTYAQETIPLYPAGMVPNYKDGGEKENRETTDILRISLVQIPDIAVYLPPKRNASGQAVVICPGGGYSILAYEWEGVEVAKLLNAKGIAAFVLKYRLPDPKSSITQHLSPLLDAKRALRYVRANAGKWNIQKDRIGIMGFSAGGHLASTMLTQFNEGDKAAKDSIEQQSSRPDFGILVYPVISMSKPIMHQGSRNRLIGANPPSELAAKYSSELQVKKETPPTFLVHAMDDAGVPVENSLLFFQAMKDKGVTGELHVYPTGGHGFGLAVGRGSLENWTTLCIEWMRSLNQKK